LTRSVFWKLGERRRRITLHHNLLPPQLACTSDDSWTAHSISRRCSTLFAASTSTSVSIHIRSAQAEDGRGLASIHTGSLGNKHCSVSVLPTRQAARASSIYGQMPKAIHQLCSPPFLRLQPQLLYDRCDLVTRLFHIH
jgi:hypothetical protein